MLRTTFQKVTAVAIATVIICYLIYFVSINVKQQKPNTAKNTERITNGQNRNVHSYGDNGDNGNDNDVIKESLENSEKMDNTQSGVSKDSEIIEQRTEHMESEDDSPIEFRVPHIITFVTLVTASTHDKTRAFVGAIHTHYPPNMRYTTHSDKEDNTRIAIYGIGLPPTLQSEIRTWKNVLFIDCDKELIKAMDLKEENNLNAEQKMVLLRPLVMKHSADLFGTIVYADVDMMLSSPLNPLIELLKSSSAKGSLFFKKNSSPDLGIYPNSEKCEEKLAILQYDSPAYHKYFKTLSRCANSFCLEEEIKVLKQTMSPDCTGSTCKDAKEAGLECNQDFGSYFTVYSNHHGNNRCNLYRRDDSMLSIQQVIYGKVFEEANTKRTGENGRIHIALGVPTTSSGNPNPQVHSSPFISVFLPSLLNTISRDDPKYLYQIYLGFDEHDPFFDNRHNQENMINEVKRITQGFPIEFHMIKVTYSKGWVVLLWNALFQHAIQNGADYFYQLNDDIHFRTPGWTGPFIEKLSTNPKLPGLGVTGPIDVNNHALFTQAFVSKVHYQIFGFLYPAVFENWYSDDWITRVYLKSASSFKTNFEVKNSQTFGTRYQNCIHEKRYLTSKEIGENLIDKFLAEKH